MENIEKSAGDLGILAGSSNANVKNAKTNDGGVVTISQNEEVAQGSEYKKNEKHSDSNVDESTQVADTAEATLSTPSKTSVETSRKLVRRLSSPARLVRTHFRPLPGSEQPPAHVIPERQDWKPDSLTKHLEDSVDKLKTDKIRGYSTIGGIPVQRYGHVHSKFELTDLLGEGGYGAVWKGTCPFDKQSYAVKLVPFTYSEAHPSQEIEVALREVKALASIKHKNVLPFVSCWIEESQEPSKLVLVIQTQLCEKTLFAVIQGPVEERCVNSDGCFCLLSELDCMIGILSGLIAIHEKKLLHRDFNPFNCLIGLDGTPMISDLGMCRDLQSGDRDDRMERGIPTMQGDGGPLLTSCHGRGPFQSPEQLSELSYSYASDIFSFGLTLLMLCDRNRRNETQWINVFDRVRVGDLPNNLLVGMCRFFPTIRSFVVNEMCAVSPSDRPTAQSLVETLHKLRKEHKMHDFFLQASTIVCNVSPGATVHALVHAAKAAFQVVGSADAPVVRWTTDLKQCEVQFASNFTPAQVAHVAQSVANVRGMYGVLYNGITYSNPEASATCSFSPAFSAPTKFGYSTLLKTMQSKTLVLDIDVERGTSMKAFQSIMTALVHTNTADSLVPSVSWLSGYKQCLLEFNGPLKIDVMSEVACELDLLDEVVGVRCNDGETDCDVRKDPY